MKWLWLMLLTPGFWMCTVELTASENSLAIASPGSSSSELRRQYRNLELAMSDLSTSFPGRYSPQFLSRLRALESALLSGDAGAYRDFAELRREALFANPLLQPQKLLVVKRRPKNVQSLISEHDRKIGFSGGPGREIGMPSNHECNSSLERDGYDNEICLLDSLGSAGRLVTIYRPDDGGYVGEIDLHWDGSRMLFSKSDAANWKIFEMRADGSRLRQVSQMPDDVDSFDACYVPNGTIIFGSTASFQSVPCWHGQKRVSNLYVMNADGSGARQLCFDQDHNFHPTILPDGQVLYHRWDYTGINHIYLRQLMVMNPDGTRQRAIYGSSSWYPNSLYFPRPLPGDATRLACILSGYHGVHRLGQFVLLDLNRGWQEAEGIAMRISGRGDPPKPMVKDNLVDVDWPKFLHPEPINDKYFLVAARLSPKGLWGIYLADVFDNLVLLRESPGYALLEPTLLRSRPVPPVIADQTDPSVRDATVYIHNVYAGPGLAGVPAGTVKTLRVIAYHFGYPGLAGPDRIGYGGPWEVMRILGTVRIEEDGSAMFKVPADTPVALQPLDAAGQAVQLMRSWFSARRGETLSCVGCHERPADAAAPTLTLAGRKAPRELTPWHGPPRGFDFEREVQPVLNRHCIGCHNGADQRPDLQPAALVTNYAGLRISDLGIRRLHPDMYDDTQGVLRYSPAYDALIHYIRRVGIEDDVSLLTPGEYQADTSPLIQLLRRGHHEVQLQPEDWDRLFTWIDLNGPCHGTWGEVYPIPENMHERRMALRRQCRGPREDPERIPVPEPPIPDVAPRAVSAASVPKPAAPEPVCVVKELPPDEPREKVVQLADGVALKLVRVPAGELITHQSSGSESNSSKDIVIREEFWMAACEISNEQYRCFDPEHDARYYTRRHARPDDQGLWLNQPKQPVVRVSWDEAIAFCEWLSKRTGMNVSLPTEAQWEWACRAGMSTDLDDDYSEWANTADVWFSRGLGKDGKQNTGGLDHLVLEGAGLADTRLDDGNIVTANIGSYRPNAWGLFDMHGNAGEWTASVCPNESVRGLTWEGERRVVRGGSFFDNARFCGSFSRVDYPKWRKVFNVGFRVICDVVASGSAQAERTDDSAFQRGDTRGYSLNSPRRH